VSISDNVPGWPLVLVTGVRNRWATARARPRRT